MPAGEATIDVVRGRSADRRADTILGFLTRQAGLNDDAARRWLSEAVCMALDGGEVVGVSSVRPAGLQLVGGRRFWIYRSFLAQDSDELWNLIFSKAFEALAEESDEGGAGCVGVCALVADRALMSRRPEAVWADTELVFAGYLPDGRQIRIRYFPGAVIGPGTPESPSLDEMRARDYGLEDRYSIQPLGASAGATTDDVLRLWARERAMPEAEAKRRVHEVELVACEREKGVVGVSSTYLQRNAQLGMDLWQLREFVARAHRRSKLAAQLIFANRDRMEERFLSGEDTRAPGIMFELENEAAKRNLNQAVWVQTGFTFIGENQRGDHVRVHYFPGAHVPLPGSGCAPDPH
jgi:hypothetical protein